MHELTPTVGQWYIRDDGFMFEIVGIDDGYIEVQNQDGSIDEIDLDDWPKLDLELGEAPEDINAAFDNVPEPDEADGGDPVEMESVTVDPLRVAHEELINNVEEDELSEGMEQVSSDYPR